MPWSWMPSGAAAYTCPGLTKRWWSALNRLCLYPRFQDKRLLSSGRKRCRRWDTLPAWRSAFSASPTFLPSQRWRCAAIRPWQISASPTCRRGRCPGLAADLTAANFGRIKSGASDADPAAALFNMIYENVGVMASPALSQDTTRNVVLTGSLASLAPAAKTFDIFNRMHDVFGIDYIIPPHPSFATAVGALLCDPLPEN